MIFFPDTNFFLHFRDPPEIPWATVTSDDTVILLICDNTARELDKKKFELRGRAQDRARKWASILGEIVDTGGPKILRATGPKVIVDLQVERPLGWIPPNDLESHNLGDDKYIADVLAYRSTANGQQCAILTADTGPLLKAKRHGLTSVRIKDDWGLPEEPDSRARTIKRLEEELAKERKRGPEVTLTAKIGTQVVKEIIIEVSKYPDLTTEKIAMLVEELATAYPCVIEFPRPDEDSKTNPSIRSPRPFDLADLAEPFDWVGPTEKQITTYRTAYGEWVERARDLMRTQPAVKQEPAFEARFELALSNEGTAPAESVWVTFEVSDGLAFKNTRRVDDSNQDHNQRGTKTTGQRPVLGVPPIAPRWKKIYRRQSSSDASPLDTLRNAKGFGLGSLHNANTFRMALPADTLAQHAGIRAMMATEEKLRGIIGPHIDSIKNYTDSYGINFADPTWSGLPRDMSNPSPFLPLLSQLPEIPRHDPEAFYWKGRPATSHSKVWAFECSVLRHRIGPEIWQIPVVAWLDSLPRNGGCITVRVHGRNLRQPVEKKIPVKLRIREENSELVVRDVLPELMRR